MMIFSNGSLLLGDRLCHFIVALNGPSIKLYKCYFEFATCLNYKIIPHLPLMIVYWFSLSFPMSPK